MTRDKFVWKEGDIEVLDTADMRLFKEKWMFLHAQVLASCRLASFQRANVYAKEALDDQRKRLHERLDLALSEIGRRYSVSISDSDHVRNIEELAARLSKECGPALAKGRMRLGIAQKALNLYLKYLWCLRRIPMPPHCPLDSRIMEYLPQDQRVSWTKIKDASEYNKVIAAAKAVAGTTPLAEWELNAYQSSFRGA